MLSKKFSWIDQFKPHVIKSISVSAFFLAYLIIGLFIIDDYGYSVDEGVQKKHGAVTAEYINDLTGGKFFKQNSFTDEDLLSYVHRAYGVTFQLVCGGLEVALRLKTDREAYLLRHVLGFLIYFLATYCFFKLLEIRLSSWKWGLLGTLFFILSPRTFAHSFFNPKDTILLAWYTISIYTLFKYTSKKSYKWIFLHALCCALLINVRVVGIVIPALTIALSIWDFSWSSNKQKWLQQEGLLSASFIPLFLMLTYIMWPFLWTNPFENIAYVFQSMGKYKWNGNVLYLGELIKGKKLPWHYIPYWMMITIPILYLFLGLSSLTIPFSHLKKNGFRLYTDLKDKMDWTLFALFIVPLASVIVLNSTLYNGWRHLFFIYPPILLLAIIFLYRIYNYTKARRHKALWRNMSHLIIIVVVISVIDTAQFMVRNHPLQNVYFNRLLSYGKASNTLDLDYWGHGYKHALKLLLDSTDEDSIFVASSTEDLPKNIKMLERNSNTRRLIYNEDQEKTGYYLTNYKWRKDRRLNQNKIFPFDSDPIFTIDVQGNRIYGIYSYDKESKKIH